MSTNKHPTGLYVLFFTEMWERFGFYLMLAIFTLYLTEHKHLSTEKATEIYGNYMGLVYLSPLFGGALADRVIGYRKAVLGGALLLGIGYLLLSLIDQPLFYVSMACLIIGNGLFKPNISTLLGNMYNAPELRDRKDSAYNIFYMGINIGAFVCNFVAAYLRNNYGWGHAFAAAGVGMAIGVVIFVAGMKQVAHADVWKYDVYYHDGNLTVHAELPASAAGRWVVDEEAVPFVNRFKGASSVLPEDGGWKVACAKRCASEARDSPLPTVSSTNCSVASATP